MKTCEICWDEFEPSRGNQKYCKECGKNPVSARNRIEKAIYINKIHAGDLYKPKEIECKECGKKMITTYYRTFCSSECALMNRITNARCPTCKQFLVNYGNESGRGYCSDSCKEQARVLRAKAKGDYIQCECCKKHFISKGPTNLNCSRDCYFKSLAKRKVDNKKIDKTKKKQPIESKIKCKYCGKEFEVGDQNSGKTYCSTQCRESNDKNMAKKKRKEVNKKIVKRKDTNDILRIGKKTNICAVCRTYQKDCERFTSNFEYSPEGSRTEKIDGKNIIIIACPKYS